MNDVYSNFINFCFVGSKNAKCAHKPCDGVSGSMKSEWRSEGPHGLWRLRQRSQTNKPPILLNIDWQERESRWAEHHKNKGDNLESGGSAVVDNFAKHHGALFTWWTHQQANSYHQNSALVHNLQEHKYGTLYMVGLCMLQQILIIFFKKKHLDPLGKTWIKNTIFLLWFSMTWSHPNLFPGRFWDAPYVVHGYIWI
jgi:hypothetical protein